MMSDGKTTSFTPQQRIQVDHVLESLVTVVLTTLRSEATTIQALDKRPKQGWTVEQPDVFLPYVFQAMLEDLIVELQARV